MFAILVPATLLPLIITLFWSEHKAKRLGIVEAASQSSARGWAATSGLGGMEILYLSSFFLGPIANLAF